MPWYPNLITTQAAIDIASINPSSIRDRLDRLKGEDALALPCLSKLKL